MCTLWLKLSSRNTSVMVAELVKRFVVDLRVLRVLDSRAMAELKAMMDAITKLTEAVTGMQQREAASLRPPGLARKKIDVRFMKVQEFDGKNEEWDVWSFFFKSSIRAQDKRAYELLLLSAVYSPRRSKSAEDSLRGRSCTMSTTQNKDRCQNHTGCRGRSCTMATTVCW